jgi:hypothetical protein
MDADKQAWLAKYATRLSHDNTYLTLGAQTADQISAILRDQFGILPKRRTIGYTKPYPSDYDLIPLCHTPVLRNRTEASIRVPRMFKSHVWQQYDKQMKYYK